MLTASISETPRELAARLNPETGRIDWRELQPHFARGLVIRVSADLDLLEAAAALTVDDGDRVRRWMDGGDAA